MSLDDVNESRDNEDNRYNLCTFTEEIFKNFIKYPEWNMKYVSCMIYRGGSRNPARSKMKLEAVIKDWQLLTIVANNSI